MPQFVEIQISHSEHRGNRGGLKGEEMCERSRDAKMVETKEEEEVICEGDRDREGRKRKIWAEMARGRRDMKVRGMETER